MRYRRYQRFKLNPIWIIIGLNLIVFVATYIFLRSVAIDIYREFISFFGLVPALFLNRPWTIVTCMFVHSGFWHIFANMLTLYFFGTYLYRLIGQSRFLFVYFGGGILGSIFYIFLTLLGGILSIRFFGSPFILAVGASGAIFALAGALVVMRPKLPVLIFPIPVPIPLWIAVIGGFFILSFLPYIAWQAHLGGLVLGLIAGSFFRKRERYFFR